MDRCAWQLCRANLARKPPAFNMLANTLSTHTHAPWFATTDMICRQYVCTRLPVHGKNESSVQSANHAPKLLLP